jgi:hypothetical protein
MKPLLKRKKKKGGKQEKEKEEEGGCEVGGGRREVGKRFPQKKSVFVSGTKPRQGRVSAISAFSKCAMFICA